MLCYHGTTNEKANLILKEGFTKNQDTRNGANLYLTKNLIVATGYGKTVLKCDIDDKEISIISLDEANKIGRCNIYNKFKRDYNCLEVKDDKGNSIEIFVYKKEIVRPIEIIKMRN